MQLCLKGFYPKYPVIPNSGTAPRIGAWL